MGTEEGAVRTYSLKVRGWYRVARGIVGILLRVLARLVAVAVVDADDHGVAGLDALERLAERPLDGFLAVAETPGGQDLESQARPRGVPHRLEHPRRVLFQVHFARRDGHVAQQFLQLLVAAVPLVNAGHVVIRLPPLRLDRVHHGRHVRGDARQHARVPHALEKIADFVQLAALEQLVGHFAVMRHAQAAAFGQQGQVGRIAAQRDRVHPAAFVDQPPIQFQVHHPGNLPAVDAGLLTPPQRFEDLLGRVVGPHLLVDEV